LAARAPTNLLYTPAMPELPFGYGLFALLAATLVAGYLIFAITGFGAALVTVPVMSHFLPLPFVLPLAVLLDVGAALVMGVRFQRNTDWGELKWMVPCSLAGAVLGVTLLVKLPREASIAGLGFCIAAYGVYSLRRGSRFVRVRRIWAPVSGFTGGAMGTLFGIGAPPYAIYLSARMQEKVAMRATLSTMVLFSTGIRLTVFTLAGLVMADRLIAFALLFPFALAGLWMGHRLHLRMSTDKVLAAISVLLIATGASLLWRAFAT
jgi:uncharacterized membrane protein YfcA